MKASQISIPFRSKRAPAPKNVPFTFIDLFAGIGGFRFALEGLGGECLFSSEWDRFSQATYTKWFGEAPNGDITKVPLAEIPDHNILAAGFPCQPFSLAGVSKKNSLGRKHGFEDPTQGTLFFEIKKIAAEKKPDVLLLENVKNLLSHDRGKTIAVIKHAIEHDLGYKLYPPHVIDARAWVPQHRERVYLVAFKDHSVRFEFPTPPKRAPRLRKILEKRVDTRYTLSDKLWNYLQAYAKKHAEKGNGFGFSVFGPDDVARTLSARYHKDGSEILIRQSRGRNPRRLTPTECAKLMGFPPDKQIVVSDTQAYRQFGNAVVVPVVRAIAREILRAWTPGPRTSRG